jgi:septal ring factor EnvC (AmiA/AmiB activator)
MAALFGILVALGYIAAAAWTFGYVRGATNDESGFDTPTPLFSALAWPITLLVAMVIVPVQRAGFTFQQHKLEQKKKRIALQEKVRIELQEAEKALDAEFDILERQEQQVVDQEDQKKKQIKRVAKELDGYFFSKTELLNGRSEASRNRAATSSRFKK